MHDRATAKPAAAPAAASILQRTCACGNHAPGGGECAACKKKRLQRQATGAHAPNVAPPIVHDVLRAPGQPLDAGTRAFMEPRFGHDFSRVRVHTDPAAAASARAVGALAYTVGPHIAFGAGQYAPGTPAGQRLLAHELTHVVQQGSAPAAVQRLAIGSAHDPLEQEADASGARVSAGGTLARGTLTPLAQTLAQRDIIDDLVDEVDEIASDAVDTVETVAQAAEDVVETTVDTASDVVGTVVDTTSEVVDTVTDTASDVIDTVTDTVSNVADAVSDAASDALSWVTTMAGAAALEAANALVGALGGSVTIGPSGLVITIPEIEIFSKHEFPLFNLALFDQTIPLLSAGIDIGPVVLAAVLGIHIAGDVKGIVYAGPGYLRGIRIALNPISGNYSAAGTLSVGEAVSEIITLTGAGMVRGYVIVITPEGPIPIPIATVEGGLKGVIRGSALGNLANAVTLGYSGGVISFTDDITLKLGALLETDLFAFAMAKIDVLNDFVLYNYHWPLAHWETSNAEQYDVSLGISYGGGGPPITISPVSKTVIPISDIETALPPIDIERRCASVEEVVAELCKQGFIPPDICKLLGMPVPPALGPGAPAPAPPVPVVPPTPADPGILVDDCADPIGKKDLGKFNVKGRDRRVTYNDKGKHTKMAKKTIARMVAIANVKNCQADSSFSQCEKEFCEAAKAKDKTYGSQIDNVTRRIERIKDLLQQAWDKTPVPVPSSGSYDIEAEDDITVGFDMDITGSTVNYRVKTTVANGGKDFNETHLFPED